MFSVATAAESPDVDVDDHPLLVEARRNVEAVAQRLADAERDRDAARSTLALVETELAEIEQRVNEAIDAVRRQEIEVEVAADRLAQMRLAMQEIEQGLGERAADLYMRGGGTTLQTILSSGDIRAALDRTSFLSLVTAGDRAELERLAAARVALAAETERFDVEMERLLRMQAEEEALLASISELREARAEALALAEREVDDLEATQDDLEDDQERIAQLIAEARSTPVAASPPSAEGYSWPLCRRITSRFGYRWGRQHKGIDIDGDRGDAIGASKAGVVIAAGWEGGYGQLTLIDHGDGVVTAYAHQSEIIVVRGQSVERGERIGSVGNTGNSTGPHLHFETRVNGRAVDPLTYLPGSC